MVGRDTNEKTKMRATKKLCARYKQNNQNARTVNLHEIHALQ